MHPTNALPQRRGVAGPLVLCGDFNATPDKAEIVELTSIFRSVCGNSLCTAAICSMCVPLSAAAVVATPGPPSVPVWG